MNRTLGSAVVLATGLIAIGCMLLWLREPADSAPPSAARLEHPSTAITAARSEPIPSDLVRRDVDAREPIRASFFSKSRRV